MALWKKRNRSLKWFAKHELPEGLSYNIGDYDQFASDLVKGLWYYQHPRLKELYRGPYRTLRLATRDWFKKLRRMTDGEIETRESLVKE